MKKTFRLMGMVLATVLMSVGFTACLNDDDDENIPSELVGTWVLDDNMAITFNSNGSGYTSYTYSNGKVETENFTFTYQDKTIAVTMDGETFELYNVSINNNVLTYTDEDGETVTLHIADSDGGTSGGTDIDGGTSGGTTSGNLLTSIAYAGGTLCSMEYDSNGNVTKFTYDSDKRYFHYDEAGKLDSMKIWDEDEWEYYTDIKLTSEGYIKSFNYQYNDGFSGSATLEYDNNGHLTNITTKDTDGDCVMKLTWDNGCLTKISNEETVVVDDPDGPESDYVTYTYTYGNETNDKKCYTSSCSMVPHLFLTGLVGKGPDYLPTSCTETDSDGDTDTYGLSYTKDGYGKIIMETVSYNDGTYTLYYNYDATSSSNAKQLPNVVAAGQSNIKQLNIQRLFGKCK